MDELWLDGVECVMGMRRVLRWVEVGMRTIAVK